MVIIFINKYSVAFISAFVVITGAVLLREIADLKDNSQVIVVDDSPEITIPQMEEVKTNAADTKAVKTTTFSEKNTSAKSAYSTKTTASTSQISEICTKTENLYIDINNAGFDELIKLNGIGDYLAEQIIIYREQNGGFSNIEEIINVSGIGEKIFESIRDYIYVENPVYFDEEIPVETETFVEITEFPTEEITTEGQSVLPEYNSVDLNTADFDTLMLLPFINEEIAQNILELRESLPESKFSNVYELLYVEGITEDMLAEIIKYIYV